ncbi:MAG: GtrA family protein [Alphaproteobacteria bacterium]|nr:GtrA family protein [Alphaproteobacteria bacterium]
MLDILKSHYKRFSKFALVGVLNTIIDFSVFAILLYGFGVYYVFAHIFGFLAANTNSFILNSLWTFKGLRRKDWWRQAGVFFAISLCGLGLSTFALYVAVGTFAAVLPGLWLPHVWGKAFASGVSMVWNYIGSWLFVFKPASDSDSPSP